MTSEDVRSELDKIPFVPLRLHLVSGKEINIKRANIAYMLQNAVLIMQDDGTGTDADPGYDIVALRNIERLEQLRGGRGTGRRRGGTVSQNPIDPTRE